MIHFVHGLAMALERILLLLRFRARVKIFDSNPSFYRSGGITCICSQYPYRSLITLRTLPIGHTCQGPGQEFQAALPSLRRCLHLPDIVDVEQTTSHRDNKVVVHKVHSVDAVG